MQMKQSKLPPSKQIEISLYEFKQLCHIALLHQISNAKTKRGDILFLYLLAFGSISKLQIHNLFSLPLEDKTNVEVYVSKKVKAGMLVKLYESGTVFIDDIYGMADKGIETAVTVFGDVLKELTISKNSYQSEVLRLLGDKAADIKSYVENARLVIVAECRKPNITSHYAYSNDIYVCLLRHLVPFSLLSHMVEVTYTLGMPRLIKDDIYQKAELRSDAVLYLPLRCDNTFLAPPTDSMNQLVSVEQDTAKQRVSVIADKIERYCNLAEQRAGIGSHPSVLIFSIMPTVALTPQVQLRKVDQYLCDTIYSLMYMKAVNENVAIGNFTFKDARDLLLSLNDERMFDRHLEIMDVMITSYGYNAAITELKNDCQKLFNRAYTFTSAIQDNRQYYVNRRETIFNAAARVSRVKGLAMKGFSICTAFNLDASSFLAHFSPFTDDEALVRLLGLGGFAECESYYTHQCFTGKEITFRYSFSVFGASRTIVENISDDYGAVLRMRELFENEYELDISCYLLVAYSDKDRLPSLLSNIREEQASNVFVIYFVYDGSSGIRYNQPICLLDL